MIQSPSASAKNPVTGMVRNTLFIIIIPVYCPVNHARFFPGTFRRRNRQNLYRYALIVVKAKVDFGRPKKRKRAENSLFFSPLKGMLFAK
jgi:hypothetical protein